MNARRLHGDDGSSLILALAFLSLLGIFVASVLSFGAVSFENSTVTRSRAKQLYAADGGVERAIRELQTQSNLCAQQSPVPTTIGTATVNGRQVTFACRTTAGGLTTTSGSPLLGDYVAVIGNGGVAVTGGGWGPAEIHGSMRSAGPMTIQWNDPDGICAAGYAPLVFEYFGLEAQHDPHECAWIDVEGNLSIAGCPPPPARVYVTETCSSSTPPAPAVPTVRIPSNSSTALAPRIVGSCTILYPGRYTNTAPINPTDFFDETKRYYLASGTYYFAGGNEVVLEGQIFGGAPSPAAPWEDTQLMGGGASPCATDAIAQTQAGLSNGQPRYNAATAGTGVTIVRGSSRLRVQGQGSKVELYTRVPATGSPDAGATPGVTFWANTSSGGTGGSQGTYTQVPNDTEIFVNSEREIDVVIHGLAYLPNSRANLTEPFNHEVGTGRGGVSFFLGGVVARRLTISRAYDNNVQRISLAGTGEGTETFDLRTTTVTATAASTSGGAPTTVTAVVEPDVSPTVIRTWRQT